MDAHKIADILFNLSLDMDYADYLDEYDIEIDYIEQELHSIKDSNDVWNLWSNGVKSRICIGNNARYATILPWKLGQNVRRRQRDE